MPFKGWHDTPWRDVAADTRVRTGDQREWIVRKEWDGQRVLLAPDTSSNMGRPVYGPVVPVPLTDGDRTVKALTPLPRRTPDETYEAAVVEDGAPDFGRPRIVAGADGEADHCSTCGKYASAGHVCASKFGAPDPVTGTRSAMMPVPDASPKFGQPAGTGTAAERIAGLTQEESTAVAELAAGGLEPQLIAVEDGGEILVPRQLDDMALRSHLFLMHGHLYPDQDVDRERMAADHAARHERPASHRHVDRSEVVRGDQP